MTYNRTELAIYLAGGYNSQMQGTGEYKLAMMLLNELTDEQIEEIVKRIELETQGVAL